MKKTIYYWSPCLDKVGTVKSTLNSAIAVSKFSKNYNVKIINVFGEWEDYKEIFLKYNEISELFVSLNPILSFVFSSEITNRLWLLPSILIFDISFSLKYMFIILPVN